jgi:glycosyltransferase involved in cell wall biosynthesis
MSPISLVIVGDGPLKQELRREACSLGLLVREASEKSHSDSRPEVVFFPFQQIDLTPLFYYLSEAFILPSHHEEWGLVINEALACRTAVLVSSNVGSHFDLIEDNVTGLVFHPSSPEQLAGLLARFDQEPSLKERLGQSGFNRIKYWTPSWFASQAIKALCAASK